MTVATLRRVRRSLHFDGATGRVTSSFVPSGTISIAVWAKRDDTAAAYCPWGMQVANGGSGIFRLETNNQINFFANSASGGTTWTAPAAAAGVWARYLLTYNATTATLYVNGVSQGANALAIALNGGALELGARGGTSNPLKGNVYGCRVWSVLLTPAEAASDAAGSSQVQRSNLLLEWSMRENGGTALRDTSGHGNAGTLQSGALWVPSVPTKAA